jgi:hypothetical protein
MPTAYSRKERRLSNSDEPNPMMNDHRSQSKFDCGLFGNLLQLMFGHFTVRFVIDSVDFAPVLEPTHNPLKIDSCACGEIDSGL